MDDLARKQITDALTHDARDIAERLKASRPALEVEKQQVEADIGTLKARLTDIEVKREAISVSPQRLADYVAIVGADLQCPCCWIYKKHGIRMEGKVGRREADDIAVCIACGHETTIRTARR